MPAEILQTLLKVSLLIFMVGNLLDMGLRLQLGTALGGLRNPRFVIPVLFSGFCLGPALACLLTNIMPLAEPYAIGLILLGMTPCAPILPPMVDRARADRGYAASMMLLTAVGTVCYMPIALPLLADGMSADAWLIVRPLLLLMLLPLVIGMAIRHNAPTIAASLHPIVRVATGIDTAFMLLLCVVIFGPGLLGAFGSFAVAAQILFFSVVTLASYALGVGLLPAQRNVLILGNSTRNVGAALAPLFALSTADQRAIVMVVLAVPMQVIFTYVAATYLARRAANTLVPG